MKTGLIPPTPILLTGVPQRLQRMILKFERYDLKVEYIPEGKTESSSASVDEDPASQKVKNKVKNGWPGLLLHLAGPGVREIFRTIPEETKGDAKDYKKAME